MIRTLANYGLERGLNDVNCATSYDDVKAYTLLGRADYRRFAARLFASPVNLPITLIKRGRSDDYRRRGHEPLVSPDMNYRGLINMLIFCGCVGQSGGGWAHYVGQEKLRPQPAGSRWRLPSTGSVRRVMNSTSYFYNHSSQWRYETVTAEELLSPMADKSPYRTLIDFNVVQNAWAGCRLRRS